MNYTIAARSVTLLAAVLGGCAPHLEGAYVDVTGAPAFRLANGKYVQNAPDRVQPRPLPYKVDGAIIIVGNGQDQDRFAILPGGALRRANNNQVFTHAPK